MSEREPLTLRETGIAHLDDGTEAVNVGPIVTALRFLTEGRGDDRGIDETGAPLPDLLSLAFDVVASIIVGGRQADYFRQVKRELDARAESGTSLGLAKHAARHTAPTAALKKAGLELQARVRKLEQAVANVMTELDALTAPPEEPATERARAPRRARKAPAKKRAPRPRAKAPSPERLTRAVKKKAPGRSAVPPRPTKKTKKKRR